MISGKVVINIPKNSDNGGGGKQKGHSTAWTKYVTDFEEYITLGVLVPGTSFGEVALISNKPRSANAIAFEDTHLATISKDIFN